MSEKVRKTLYIPRWIEIILDAEGKKCGGPGTVISAAISLFHGLAKPQKIKAMKSYRDREVHFAYANKQIDQLVLLDMVKNSSLSRQTKQDLVAILDHKPPESSEKSGRKARPSKNVMAG